jgi:hypothetical protein
VRFGFVFGYAQGANDANREIHPNLILIFQTLGFAGFIPDGTAEAAPATPLNLPVRSASD